MSGTDAAAALAAMQRGLEDVGRNPASGGYRRYAWRHADLDCRAWFADQARSRGMDVVVDRNGNQWAWWGDPDRDGRGVVTGSHLDSVPDGGAFDGPLGVMSAFAAVDALRAEQPAPQRPLAVVNFADEEGARFGMACVGSRLLTGLASTERVGALTDVDGVGLAEAVSAAGVDPRHLGRDDEALGRVGTFVELHVEQGKGLVDAGSPVGVATSIWPHGRWRFDFAGEANHAGTTALADRHDPMIGLANAVLDARRLAAEHEALATFGRVDVQPNSTNSIPSLVRAWLDTRAPTEATVRAVVDQLTVATGAEVTEESWTPLVDFDAALRDRLATVLGDAPVLPTGAGHDAGILASAGIPTAMLFVRNPTGISHSPDEYAEPVDCVSGVEALTTVLRELTTPERTTSI